MLPSLDLSGLKQRLLSFSNFHIGMLEDRRGDLASGGDTVVSTKFENCLFTGSSHIGLANIGQYSFINSKWSQTDKGSQSSVPLVDFNGLEVTFSNCSFEGNVLDQSNVLLSILATRHVGFRGSSFIQNSVSEKSDGSALIAIHGHPVYVDVIQTKFSCNGIREADGKLRYPFPVQMDVSRTFTVAEANTVEECPITDQV